MKKKLNLFGVLLSIVLFVTGCGCSNGTIVAKKETKRKASTGDRWTVMLYMSASTLESEHNRAGEVLSTLAYDLPENINVIVEVGGCDSWSIEGIKPDKIQDFAVQKNGIRLIGEHDAQNMGKARTYANFLNRTMEKYPADKYISVIWGEGGGPISGVAHDMTEDFDSLTPDEVANAIASTETKLDMIGFDANLMASLETAAALVPYADYMVASEDIMPMSGWDYRGLFEFLSDNPDAGVAQVGQVICDGVLNTAPDETESLATMSVIDLSDVTKLMQDFDTMARGMAQDCEDISKLRAMTAKIDSAHFVGANAVWEGYSNLVDLESFQTAVYGAVKSDYARIKRAIDQAVIYKTSGKLQEDLCGISIYYPKSRDNGEIDKYRKICTSLGYMEYIDKTVVNDNSEGKSADYKQTASRIAYESVIGASTITAEPDLNGKYLLTVTNPDIIAKTGVNLYKYNEETGVYFYLSCDNDTYYSNIANTYEYKLRNKQLELNKIPVSTYLVNDFGDRKIYSIPVVYNDELSSLRVLEQEDETKKTYTVMGIWQGIDKKTGITGRKYSLPSVGESIIPVYETYGGTNGSYARGKRLTLVFGGLSVKEKSLDDGEYLLSYTTEDIYGIEQESNPANVTAIKGKMQISK